VFVFAAEDFKHTLLDVIVKINACTLPAGVAAAVAGRDRRETRRGPRWSGCSLKDTGQGKYELSAVLVKGQVINCPLAASDLTQGRDASETYMQYVIML